MTTNTSALWINDGGFRTIEIEAGIRAAEAVLQAAGFTSGEAHAAAVAEAEGQPHDVAACDAWRAAEAAAIETASAGWARAPEGAVLVLA